MLPMRRYGILFVLIGMLGLFGATPALAATHTWIGPPNGTWSNAANWSGGSVPTSGELGGTIVKFGSNTTSSMNIAGLVVDQIDFTGANNTINGTTPLAINGETLAQNIVSQGAGNTLATALPLVLTGEELIEVTSGAGTLTIGGAISGEPGLAFVGMGGSFALTAGNTGNTYTGATTITSGAVYIATANGVVFAGSSVTVGTGSGPGAELILNHQSSDISPNTAVTVNSDGVFEFEDEIDSAKSLTVNGGSVQHVGALNMAGPLAMNGGTIGLGTNTLSGFLSAGSLNMVGGTIGASGTGTLKLSGNVQATSAPSGPATIASGLQLAASPTVTVTPGVAPELRVTGVISETGGSRSITKTGAGTMLTSAQNTYTGTTTVNAGVLLADGSDGGAFSVGPNGALGGSGTVGATTVAGVLNPVPPGLSTGSLSFEATGRLDSYLTSVAPGTVPSVITTGPVSINPSAALNLAVAPGTAMPHGSSVLLIDNRGLEAIGGEFNGVPNSFVFTTFAGVPLAVNYAGGNGNDLSLTAGNVPPQIGSVSATPNPVAAGQQVALGVPVSDANQDQLTTTWNFGDGSTGTGPVTSHAYQTPGVYTAVATVSDGLAQAQSTIAITVTRNAAEKAPAAPKPTVPTTSSVEASAFGTNFSLTVPHPCLRRGAPLGVTLTVKKPAGQGKRGVVAKVVKVVFAIAGKKVKTVRSAPYRLKLTLKPAPASGSTVTVRATAYLVVHGKTRTKSITTTIAVC
jgi:autotransporter-associated beta strand protein